MINCILEVEDVACPVDDMKKLDCSRSEGSGKRGREGRRKDEGTD